MIEDHVLDSRDARRYRRAVAYLPALREADTATGRPEAFTAYLTALRLVRRPGAGAPMSTYQHYAFIAVDRPLSQAAQAALRQMSTRATITSSSFTNTYHWGDLKAVPQRLVEKYFDAFLYTTDWGTRQLMFRFPQHLIDLDTAHEYCYSESANAWTKGSHTLINLTYSAENYDDPDYADFDDGEGRLGSIVPARSEVLGGDRRLLYLAWLLSADSGMLEDDELEPPVPAGLGQMSGPLQAVAEFLKIDAHLLTAAAESSPDLLPSTAQDNTALKTWIIALPEKEKNRLLVSAAQDKISNIGAELRMRFRQAQQPPPHPPTMLRTRHGRLETC